ncbi:hypothetical protein, partial [Acaryochloris thomasi]|uniref:hypothetical protein n=1 Tax=Acaryochloris thomasi TaxID=2929456 RepID=UPI001F3134E5
DFNWNNLDPSSLTSTVGTAASSDLTSADTKRKSVLAALGFTAEEIPSNTGLQDRVNGISSIYVSTTANS